MQHSFLLVVYFAYLKGSFIISMNAADPVLFPINLKDNKIEIKYMLT